MKYRTTRDVRLDVLVDRLMSTTAGGAVEAFLKANRGLAAAGPIVAAGTDVVVPDLPAPTTVGFTRVWE